MLFVKDLFVYYLALFMATLQLVQELPLNIAATSRFPFATTE